MAKSVFLIEFDKIQSPYNQRCAYLMMEFAVRIQISLDFLLNVFIKLGKYLNRPKCAKSENSLKLIKQIRAATQN